MELKIAVSDKMSGEDDVIRMKDDFIKASGLELGSKLNITCKDGSSIVLRVEPSTEGTVMVSRKTYRAIKEYKYKTTLGCDPEFVFVDSLGRVCSASSFLKKLGSGRFPMPFL